MEEPSRPRWLDRLAAWLGHEPETRDELIEMLQGAVDHNLLDADAMLMMEGVIYVTEQQVRHIMVPRAQMDVLDINEPMEKLIPIVIETAHSRFPVIDKNRDDVVGILLAKDLLQYYANTGFHLREMLRPAVFVPESKRLNVLLKEFRVSRNHMAIVVDEFGGVSGLVTIEDVLEQIVGNIEDEYDFDETEDNIIQDKGGRYRIKAVTELGDFNAVFGTTYEAGDFGSTIGGLVLHHFGHMPKRGEAIVFDGLHFEVLRADSRRIHTLLAEKRSG